MHEQHPSTIQQITGRVLSMFYLVDESTTILTIQADGHTITACASGQVALDLRALPRGATVCVTLQDASYHELQIVAFTRSLPDSDIPVRWGAGVRSCLTSQSGLGFSMVPRIPLERSAARR